MRGVALAAAAAAVVLDVVGQVAEEAPRGVSQTSQAFFDYSTPLITNFYSTDQLCIHVQIKI